MSKRKKSRSMFLPLLVAVLVFSPVSILCADEQTHHDGHKEMAEVSKDVDDTLLAIKNYSIDKKDEVMAKAGDILDKMDAKIDKLEKQSSEQWQDMSEVSREKTRQALHELRKKRNDIAEWYGGMKHGSTEAWGEMKKGFVESYHSLQQAFDNASKKF